MKSRNANSVELQMKIYMFGIGGGGGKLLNAGTCSQSFKVSL